MIHCTLGVSGSLCGVTSVRMFTRVELVLYMRRESPPLHGGLLRCDILRRRRRGKSGDLGSGAVPHRAVWGRRRRQGGPRRQGQLRAHGVAQVGVAVRRGVPRVQHPHSSVGRLDCGIEGVRWGRGIVVPGVVDVRDVPVVVLTILKRVKNVKLVDKTPTRNQTIEKYDDKTIIVF